MDDTPKESTEKARTLTVTFLVPVLNGEAFLERCLGSIRAQDYPQDSVEIIIADAGSTDSSLRIAMKHGAKVIPNPKRLAEYGLQAGMKEAAGDIVVVFAADNELPSREWIRTVAKTFADFHECSAVWGPLRSGPGDPHINRYFQLIQSDPMTFFMNSNIRTYLRTTGLQASDQTFLFRVDPGRPLVWGANGLAVRRSFVKGIWEQDGYLGDNDAFQKMIEEGHDLVAYIPHHATYHHHVRRVGECVKKWKRNFVLHFLSNLDTRNTNWVFVKDFRAKLILWVAYSLFPPASIVHALYLSARDRDLHWLYHPLLSFLQTLVYAYFMATTPRGRDTIFRIARGRAAGGETA